MTKLFKEPSSQFLARMIVATREQQQISSSDAQRLADHATYGNHIPTTMPEARKSASTVLSSPLPGELVSD